MIKEFCYSFICNFITIVSNILYDVPLGDLYNFWTFMTNLFIILNYYII